MRKMILLAVMMALAAMMLAAAPALADDNDDDFCDHHDCDREDICDLLDIDDEDCFDFDRDRDLVRDFDFEDGIFSQDVKQEAESGDVDQSFDVSQTGDNSNQCVGVQGVANTGNAQNVTDVTQLGAQEEDDLNDFDGERFFFDDFGFFLDGFDRFDGDGGDLEFEEVGSTIEVSPTNTTSCDQQVNQAATATG